MAQHNLGTVIRFEFLRTISKRRFWVATLFVPVVLIIVFLLVFVSNSSTSKSAEAQKNAHFSFQYTDASALINPGIVDKLGGTQATNTTDGVSAVKAGKVDAFFAYPADPVKQTVKVYGKDEGLFSNGKYSSVAQSILQASVEQKINAPQATAIIQGNVNTDTTTFKNGAVSGGFNAVLPALLFLALFYVAILLLGNQMLSSTLEEKENRVTEMILTTINPTSLILGKVVSLFMVGLLQMLVFAIPTILGYLFFRDQLSIPDLNLSDLVFDPQQMIIGALILLGGFSLFTATLVALGAVMPTAKDAGPIFGALMVLIFVPFYTVSLVISDPDATIVQVFSFFPYSAPVTALLRNAFGTPAVMGGDRHHRRTLRPLRDRVPHRRATVQVRLHRVLEKGVHPQRPDATAREGDGASGIGARSLHSPSVTSGQTLQLLECAAYTGARGRARPRGGDARDGRHPPRVRGMSEGRGRAV